MNIEQKLVEYLEAFEAAAVSLAPQALELVLAFVRVESIGWLASGIITVIIAALAIKFGTRLLRRANELENKGDEGASVCGVSGILLTVAGAIMGVIGTVNTLYIWNWVGAFAPEVRLAHDIFRKVTGE